MDFSERDVFGEEFNKTEEEEDEDRQQNDDNSSASSSSSSSSSYSSGSADSSSDAADEDDVSSAIAMMPTTTPTTVRHQDLFGSEESEEEDVEVDQEEEDERDLFGSDNEEYVKTSARSPYLIPVLPPIQSTNNHTRGNFGRNRGSGLLPRPAYGQRQNFGYGGRFNANARNPENFVSEMRLTKSEETLSRKAIAFQEPCEIACYSRIEGGEVYFDDRGSRLFKRLVSEDVGANLNVGFESFIEKRDLGSEGFGDLLACIRSTNMPLQNIHFVTYRNNLNKILATAYIKNEPWKMGVHKRKGTVYLDVHKLPERPQTDLDRRRCYWGYAFENLATENSTEIDGDGRGIDANVEFCSVIKTKLGAHRIIMGAEMDCCDAHDDGRKFYIELKTSRELDYRTEERFEREKLLKFWIQSFIAGVPYIVIGFRDDAGMLVRTERLRTKDITQRVKMKGYWQGGVCLAFADEVLCWLYGTVKENEDYILQFVHPFQRLELLKAPSCPDAITQHVDQLQII